MRLTTSAALLGFSLMKNSSGLGMLPAADADKLSHCIYLSKIDYTMLRVFIPDNNPSLTVRIWLWCVELGLMELAAGERLMT